MREDDRARWTKLVADFDSADLSQREFAQERGARTGHADRPFRAMPITCSGQGDHPGRDAAG
jgi:hypothetical protein